MSEAAAKMNDLDWLVGHRFQEALRYEFSWSFVFDGGVSVTVECIWRLIAGGRITITSEDDGHQFGLPERRDGVLALGKSLSGSPITSVVLRSGTLDLDLLFESGHILQLIPDSSGYEAWQVHEPSRLFIAVGGDDLTIFGPIS